MVNGMMMMMMMMIAVVVILSVLGSIAAARTADHQQQHHQHKQYDYNKIDHVDMDSYQEFHEKYFNNPVDGKQTAGVNIVLGVATDACKHLLNECAAFLGVQRMAAHDVLHAVSISADDYPYKMNACAEVFYYPIGNTIAEPTARTTELSNRDFTEWSRGITGINVKFVNDFEFPIAISYVGESQQATPQSVMEPGAQYAISTFLGHMFTAHQLSDRSAYPDRLAEMPMVDYFMVESNEYHFNPQNRLETCEVIESSEFLDNQTIGCDDMSVRFADYSFRHWYSKRLGLNFVQPKLVEPASISRNGFELRKLPKATYNWLRAWYDHEQLLNEVGEGSAGPCMNQLVAPSQITHLPSKLKDRLADELRPIVQDWYRGNSDLLMTSIYGVR
jgi:Tfp pilus assembly protein PilE